MQIIGAAKLREIEISWGERPDGLFLYTSSQQLTEFEKRLDNARVEYPQEFTIIDNKIAVEVSDVLREQVEKHSGLWLSSRQVSQHVKSGDLIMV